MAQTLDQITQGIVNQLRLLDPAVSAEVGTPERKIIEAVAEIIASQQVDFSVLDQVHDLSTLSGNKLDSYLSIFTFGRQQATPAVGVVTFSRTTGATSQIVIPAGTQVQANINQGAFPALIFVTIDSVVIGVNSTSVDAVAQCTVAGTVGNIDANRVVGFGGLQGIIGISSVTNEQSFSGGLDQESDTSYKARFQNTFLRNISGTNDMYLALAVSMPTVTKANVVGATSRYQELVQVPSSNDTAQSTQAGGYDDTGTTYPNKRTTAKSTIPYSKYTYHENNYLTNGTLDPSTSTFFRSGVDYIFNTPPIKASVGGTQSNDTPTTSPNVTILHPTTNPSLAGGTVLLMEHAYISSHSRNDTNFGIYNCVDVYVNGEQPTVVSSIEVVPPSSHNLQATDTTLWTYQRTAATAVINWRRKLDGVASTVGNRIQPVNWQPVLDLPDTIQVGTSTYYKAKYYNSGDGKYYAQYDGTTYSYLAHYILSEEVTSYYGTVRSRSGIEWFLSGDNWVKGQLASDIADAYNGAKIDTLGGTQFTLVNYTFDSNISDLQVVAEAKKQTTTDPLVHRARRRYFSPIVTIIYNIGVTKSVVDSSISAALNAFFTNQFFGSSIQLSDILQTIHNVPGVDNVRWTHDDPVSGNKVEEVAVAGLSFSPQVFFQNDFFLQDNEMALSPTSNSVQITARAPNTWSS